MFTGIVQSMGRLARRQAHGTDQRLLVKTEGAALEGVAVGDSVAVNGVCLTATSLEEGGFWADVSNETLAYTTLGRLSDGAPVNLEPSLTLSQPLGGHLMSGHVDGVGTITDRAADGRSVRLMVEAPQTLARYVARKGSIAVDGISLTVNAVNGARFELNIVPHTLSATTLDRIEPGMRVNLEVDLLARYLERLILGDEPVDSGSGNLETLLQTRGFMSER
jgi:riboflavin synthase